MNTLLQTLISGLMIGAVYGLIALGFTIVYNATRVVNFAHGEFVMMGGVLSTWLLTAHDFPLPIAVLAAIGLVTILGILLDRVALRSARHQDPLTLMMITIGMAVGFRGLMQVVVGRDVIFLEPFGGIPTIIFGEVFIPSQGLWIFLLLLLCSVVLYFLFAHTKIGKAMRAASENKRAAALCGINPPTMSALSFAIAAALGALAGAAVAPISAAFYEYGLFFGLKGFAAAILGGLGNPLGAVVGGLAIGLLESVTAGYISSAFKDGVALVVLILLLLVRPSGLLGQAEIKRV
ncbi:branched-chain amino acid ABC transporter permease [Rhizobium sp. Root1204]|uniref:branched-chain amino acid ABC transporter permease n=1 Tax=Rhizobium sp. Root1204 TaxID=1736428 RepID=UPI000714D0A9|nr:branched-chain amino acid ABC transporter permease [Rhizobium sp. Root1204]KQV41316.1 hypothetical protein ASC96_18660 [Rhizobium sp. Root1204]